MRSRLLILICISCLVTFLPSAGAALPETARGTASTSISLASVSFTSPTSTSSADVSTTVNIGVGSGFATSDPARNHLDRLKAFFSLVAASAGGVTQVSTPAFDATAESDSSPSTDSAADENSPVTSESLLSGGITLTALSAHVDPRVNAAAKSPSAKASLGEALMDIDVGVGLVELSGVRIAVSSLADTSQAEAFQGIEVGRVGILPLGELFDRVGGIDPLATADELVALAASFGGPTVQSIHSAVVAARDAALASINDCLTGVSPTVCAPLAPLSLSPLPSNTSVQGLLDYGASFSASCTTLLAGLGALADAVCADIVPVVTGAVASLPGLLQDLLDELAPQALLSVTNLVANVGASATDVTSSAIASGGWDSAVVLGNDLAGVTDTANPSVALDRIDSELAALEALLKVFPQLDGLSIELDPLFKEPVTGTDGAYKTARSQLSLLRMLIQLPAAGPSTTGFRAAALGDPFVLDARALTLAGYAEHRPATNPRPGACVTACMADTGPAMGSLRWLGALILLALGLGLRRWLGDAA